MSFNLYGGEFQVINVITIINCKGENDAFLETTGEVLNIGCEKMHITYMFGNSTMLREHHCYIVNSC